MRYGKSRQIFDQGQRQEFVSRDVGQRCWVVVMVIILNWMAFGCGSSPPPFTTRLNTAQKACLRELNEHAFRVMRPDDPGGGLPLSPSEAVRDRGKGIPAGSS